MKADFTDTLRCLIDDILPPIVRDNSLFVGIIFKLIFGKKSKYIMEFKDKALLLSNNEFEEYYRMFPNMERPTDLNKKCFNKILNNIVGESVLDAGCGRGFLAETISKNKKIKVVGLDINIPEQVQESENLIFLKSNIEQLPFTDNEFDTVICTHTLEHVIHINNTISELRRVAKKRIIIVVPKERPYKYSFNLHIHFFPYTYILQEVMDNSGAECSLIDGEIFYYEDILKTI